MERFRFVDSDSHVLEPEDMWDNYLEKRHQGMVKGYFKYVRASELGDRIALRGIGENPLCLTSAINVMGHQIMGGAQHEVGTADREPIELDGPYEKWAEQNFPPSAYKEVMEQSGIDYMIVYPTVGFWTTSVPDMEAGTATAIRRAYNRWLGDFCQEGGRDRLIGAVSIDLRDPEAARQEVTRCVKEYGFGSVHLNPAPVPNLRLYDEVCDPLWATCADLGVPIGLHPSAQNPLDQGLLNYHRGLGDLQNTVGFCIGNMMACASFITGGVLERHPKLKLIFLESGAGWAAYWPERMESAVNGGNRGVRITGLSKWPIEYFQEQCFIAADQDDPGLKMVIDAVGDQVLITGTDFGHPEGRKYATAVQDLLEVPGISLDSKRKILWDNAVRAYPITLK